MKHGFGELDAHLMREGKHPRLYEVLGSHPVAGGTRFSVWAPHASEVSVVGEFNGWKPGVNPLQLITNPETGGVWSGVVPNVTRGALYKYHVRSKVRGYEVAKADPFALRHEVAPGTASYVWTVDYRWHDAEWMKHRAARSATSAPISIYEVHLGSWMRVPEDGNRSLSYTEIAPRPTFGTTPVHTPPDSGFVIGTSGFAPGFQPLNSPITLTTAACGAHVENCVPPATGCAPSLS